MVSKKDAGEKIDPGTAAMIQEANNEIIRVIEMTRETEDPYYESPFVETNIDYGEDEEDLAAILEDLPEPRGLFRRVNPGCCLFQDFCFFPHLVHLPGDSAMILTPGK